MLGTHNIFEVASCFKSGDPNKIEEGKRIAKFLKELQPCLILYPVDIQIKSELKQLAEAQWAHSQLYLTDRDKEACEKEIEKLSNGIYDDRACNFIAKKWESKQGEVWELNDYVFRYKKLRDALKNIDFQIFLDTYPNFKEELTGILVRKNVCIAAPTAASKKILINKIVHKVLKNKNKCPVLMSSIRANLYTCYRGIQNYSSKNANAVSHDFWDDVVHIISSVSCDLFVTDDNKIASYFKNIRPHGHIESYDSFFCTMI